MSRLLTLGYSFAIGLTILSMHHVKAGEWPPVEPADLLQRLQAKDAQFDNLAVKFEKWELQAPDLMGALLKANGAADAGDPAAPMPAQPPIPSTRTTLQRLIVKGKEATLESTRAPRPGDPEFGQPVWFSKTTTAGGMERNIVVAGDVKVRHDDSRPARPNSVFAEHVRHIRFCLGVGYSSHILRINSITPAGDLIEVDATLRLWEQDETTAKLTIDRDLVVRAADLKADMRGHITHFAIESSGLATASGGATFATAGKFKRTAVAGVVRGKEVELNRVDDEFSLHVTSLQDNLTPQQYDKLADLDLATVTHVVDLTPQDAKLANIIASCVVRSDENRSRLGDFALVWDRQTFDNGFQEGRTAISSGNARMWRQGDRVAVHYTESKLEQDAVQGQQPQPTTLTGRKVFDGQKFRMSVSIDGQPARRGPNNARFTANDNWLDLIRWNEGDHDFLKLVSDLPKETKVTSWEMDGDKLIVLLTTPGQGSSKSVLDMARGCCLVSDEWYTAAGALTCKRHRNSPKWSKECGSRRWSKPKASTPRQARSNSASATRWCCRNARSTRRQWYRRGCLSCHCLAKRTIK